MVLNRIHNALITCSEQVTSVFEFATLTRSEKAETENRLKCFTWIGTWSLACCHLMLLWIYKSFFLLLLDNLGHPHAELDWLYAFSFTQVEWKYVVQYLNATRSLSFLIKTNKMRTVVKYLRFLSKWFNYSLGQIVRVCTFQYIWLRNISHWLIGH